MNEEQIVLSLIAFYKKEGIDLHQLLDDPLFNALPVAKKVELIKEHARQIHDGIHSGFSKREFRDARNDALLKSLIGGFTGLQLGRVAAKAFGPAGKLGPMAIPIGMITGATYGATYAGMEMVDRVKDKNKIKDQLAFLASNPSDDSAIQTLALRSLQVRKPSSSLFKKIIDQVQTHVEPEVYKRNVGLAVDEYNSKNLGLKKVDSK